MSPIHHVSPIPLSHSLSHSFSHSWSLHPHTVASQLVAVSLLPQAAHCSNEGGNPYTVVPSTPLIAEKPFISADPSSGKFTLNIPAVRTSSVGIDWSTGTAVTFDNVYVASNGSDTAASINAKLAAGLHVVLTPGVYLLSEPLQITTAGQVLLGIGFPTLVRVVTILTLCLLLQPLAHCSIGVAAGV